MANIWKVSGFAAGAFLAWAVSASAAVYTFEKITNNGNVDVGSQLQMTVSDAGAGKIKFRFDNLGPIASSIADIYFDADGWLIPPVEVGADSGAGVSFSPLASPGALPGQNGATPAFVSTAQLSADSDAPVQPMGINPGEWLELLLKVANPVAGYFALITGAIDAGGTNGIRAGLHVQAIGTTGGSDSYVNTVANSVPLPAAAWLMLAGLGGLGLMSRRKAKAA